MFAKAHKHIRELYGLLEYLIRVSIALNRTQDKRRVTDEIPEDTLIIQNYNLYTRRYGRIDLLCSYLSYTATWLQ